MSILRELLTQAVELCASDVHLKAFHEPSFRIDGDLTGCGRRALAPDDLHRIAAELVPAHLQRRFEVEHEADFSLQEEGVGRFRVNVFLSHGVPAVVLRHVKTQAPTFEDLHLPAILRQLSMKPRGILLVGGTTGSGKSTTLAAMIQHINANKPVRIITVEDPIEYVFTDEQAVISQREIGLDTLAYHAALKYVLRQDPDVIMIGEMRDAESFMAALSAAETGHLILSTLHTASAGQSLNRILDFFPASERDQIRMALAFNLCAVICQRLMPAVAGGVVPAVETLINTGTVQKLIEKNLLEKLPSAVETGGSEGMQSFDQAIAALVKSGAVTEADGMRFSTNPQSLEMRLKGIVLSEDNRILV